MKEKQKTKGYVSWSGGKPYRGQMSFTIRLKNEEKWYQCGPADPKVQKGDLVEFEYEENNGYYNVFVDSIRVIDLGATPSSGTSGVSGPKYSSGNKGAGKDGYWDERLSRDIENDNYRRGNDIRIQYQAARNSAIAVLDILTREKALIIPDKKGAASEVIMAKLEDLTNEFFHKTSAVGVNTSETVEEDREAA